MFVSTRNESGVSTPNSYNVAGGSGTISYASTNSEGWSSEGTFSKGDLTLIKWEGVANSNTISIAPNGGSKNGIAYAAMKVIPEPSTATLGLLGLSSLMLRRRRK